VSPFQKFVSAHAKLFREGKKLPLGGGKSFPRPKISDTAPRALIFSPHPDDECITGGLALRLLHEAKWRIINVAVTLGSNRERRWPRQRELWKACASLGFNLFEPDRRGLEKINLQTRTINRAKWNSAVRTIAEIIAAQKPRVIFLPHENDGHPTHVGTHFLVLDALKRLPKNFSCQVVETEFWGQMADPNLLVEIGEKDLADLVAALACHAGEVRRNAYHARLPAWMMDNVRRGAELVGSRGGAAPDFAFGTIYRLGKWRGGKIIYGGKKILSRRENAGGLFK
jgi:LmbE family N-acetylglucosaminyl deacetylase